MSSVTFKNRSYCYKLNLYGITDSNLLFSAEIQTEDFLMMHFSYHILKVMYNLMDRSTQFSKKKPKFLTSSCLKMLFLYPTFRRCLDNKATKIEFIALLC